MFTDNRAATQRVTLCCFLTENSVKGKTVVIYLSVVKVHNFCYIFLNVLYVSYVHNVPFYFYYIRNQLDATLAVLFINNCKNTLHVSDVQRVHHQEYINCSSSHYYFVDNRPWTSLLDIYHPDTWHAPVAATTVYVLLMMDAVNVRNM